MILISLRVFCIKILKIQIIIKNFFFIQPKNTKIIEFSQK